MRTSSRSQCLSCLCEKDLPEGAPNVVASARVACQTERERENEGRSELCIRGPSRSSAALFASAGSNFCSSSPRVVSRNRDILLPRPGSILRPGFLVPSFSALFLSKSPPGEGREAPPLCCRKDFSVRRNATLRITRRSHAAGRLFD
ncbi:hypothetical protein TGRUB_229800 [Toxoplasma gondii RUB]|uniref:Uncharacterized protein n=4 Tax=Toxoplasma gondii TaxID=5811 RepID=V5BKK9_TOXGV|nr:hypothetical protein TGVEG_229800 [Toxoplasma gondii VEG]KFG50768.1 hypothetical protein TGP89_229800 [Toxoplasma gondii p89]KFG63532.1 hypothetical protein TGRUB_229800 [Toxoplasma gondii RUB]KYF45964.1 hypothetical protein TGARI_229800 [Toxoplasma gondii ARI]